MSEIDTEISDLRTALKLANARGDRYEAEIKWLRAKIEELEIELWHERALRGAWQEAVRRALKEKP